jgi:hypothetical protein
VVCRRVPFRFAVGRELLGLSGPWQFNRSEIQGRSKGRLTMPPFHPLLWAASPPPVQADPSDSLRSAWTGTGGKHRAETNSTVWAYPASFEHSALLRDDDPSNWVRDLKVKDLLSLLRSVCNTLVAETPRSRVPPCAARPSGSALRHRLAVELECQPRMGLWPGSFGRWQWHPGLMAAAQPLLGGAQ